MPYIFLSYSRKDSSFVDNLITRLEAIGINVWVDRQDIKAGALWERQIVTAIDQCEAFLILLTLNSVQSDHVRTELDLGKESKKPVLPMKIGEVSLPPELRYLLAGIQFIDLSGDFETSFSQLVQAIAFVAPAFQSALSKLPVSPTSTSQAISPTPEVTTGRSKPPGSPTDRSQLRMVPWWGWTLILGLLIIVVVFVIREFTTGPAFHADAPSPIPSNLPLPATSTPTLMATPTATLVEPTAAPTKEPLTPTPTLTPTPSPYFGPILFCLDQSCTAGYKINFAQGIKKVYFQWEYQGMQPGVPYERQWYVNGNRYMDYNCVWKVGWPSSGTFLNYTYDNGPSGMAPGDWLLETYLNGQIQATATFHISGPHRTEGFFNRECNDKSPNLAEAGN